MEKLRFTTRVMGALRIDWLLGQWTSISARNLLGTDTQHSGEVVVKRPFSGLTALMPADIYGNARV